MLLQADGGWLNKECRSRLWVDLRPQTRKSMKVPSEWIRVKNWQISVVPIQWTEIGLGLKSHSVDTQHRSLWKIKTDA